MSPKNYEKSELFFGIASDNGAIRELGRISDFPTIGYPHESEEEYASGYISAEDKELVIDLSDVIPISRATRSDLFFVLACGLDIDKITQNNWRKLHNLPMKRRGYHGCRKRNNF